MISKFVKIIYFVFTEIETIRPFVYMCTHCSDEVVSLLISGYEIVVYSCSPMAARYIRFLGDNTRFFKNGRCFYNLSASR